MSFLLVYIHILGKSILNTFSGQQFLPVIALDFGAKYFPTLCQNLTELGVLLLCRCRDVTPSKKFMSLGLDDDLILRYSS